MSRLTLLDLPVGPSFCGCCRAVFCTGVCASAHHDPCLCVSSLDASCSCARLAALWPQAWWLWAPLPPQASRRSRSASPSCPCLRATIPSSLTASLLRVLPWIDVKFYQRLFLQLSTWYLFFLSKFLNVKYIVDFQMLNLANIYLAFKFSRWNTS